jgi:chromosome segregation ATPase
MNRYAIIAALVACLMAGGGGFYLGGKIEAAKSAEALIAANAKNAEKQKAIFRAVDKVAQDVETERRQIEDRLAGAGDALERLRAQIRDADARADTAATCVADGKTARAQLAQCAGKYRDMAERADRLRAAVLGLQSYARAVSGED